MAQQQLLFAEAITGMKKALIRDDEASDSDDSIKRPTNRGNKLKRKARFVQEGRLDQADGPRVYKRKLNYNGYQREIISKNPVRVDADGDVFDDEEESNPDLTDAEDDPYEDVKLEELLMPLTNAADLDKHPSLSIPYKSRVVEEMIQSAQDMVFREQRSLYRMRLLLTQFRGDETWIPCGVLQQESDIFNLQVPAGSVSMAPSVITDLTQPNAHWDAVSGLKSPATVEATPKGSNGVASSNKAIEEVSASGPATVQHNGDAKPSDEALPAEAERKLKGEEVPSNMKKELEDNDTNNESTEGQQVEEDDDQAMVDAPTTNGTANGTDNVHEANGIQTRDMAENGNGQDIEVDNDKNAEGEEEGDEDDETQQTHRMTTRARAQATDNATTPPGSRPLSPQTDSGAPLIHPFFSVPASCLPQPSLGLQGNLADDTRRLLASFVQKQEEVVRQAEALLTGLMKTQRLRNTVWSWCRAEGHVGEMSDGEDWYDMEAWGLDEPLKKGEEIEDDDVGPTVAGSKTRGRNRRNDRM